MAIDAVETPKEETPYRSTNRIELVDDAARSTVRPHWGSEAEEIYGESVTSGIGLYSSAGMRNPPVTRSWRWAWKM